jgi:hypothetical protein
MSASSTATSIFSAGTKASERLNNAGMSQSGIEAPVPTNHANKVGVAAYLSIMNPAPAIAMQTEA